MLTGDVDDINSDDGIDGLLLSCGREGKLVGVALKNIAADKSCDHWTFEGNFQNIQER